MEPESAFVRLRLSKRIRLRSLPRSFSALRAEPIAWSFWKRATSPRCSRGTASRILETLVVMALLLPAGSGDLGPRRHVPVGDGRGPPARDGDDSDGNGGGDGRDGALAR